MKTKTTFKITVLWLIMLILAMDIVFAIGVRPAATSIAYDKSSYLSGTVWVVNNDQRAFRAKIYLDGEMGKYVTLKSPVGGELTFRADDDALPIDFEILLNETPPAGISIANIIIEENLGSPQSSGISSKLVLKHKIQIEGPYPDKYVTTKLNFHDQGEAIQLVSEVENLGKMDISKVQTKFFVNNLEQAPVQVESEAASLAKQENKLLTASLEKTQFQEGEFLVSAVTYYDDQKVEMQKKMVIGKPKVDITYFTPYFVARKISPYSMDLLNEWNQKIENIFVDVKINKDNKTIDSFRTRSVDIEGLKTQRINDYLDARNKDTGKYEFLMAINFWNTYKMDQKIFNVELLEEGSETPSSNLAGRAASGAQSNSSAWIWWIIGMAIIISIISFIIYRYKHKEEYE